MHIILTLQPDVGLLRLNCTLFIFAGFRHFAEGLEAPFATSPEGLKLFLRGKNGGKKKNAIYFLKPKVIFWCHLG